jgi:hypothetical protein
LASRTLSRMGWQELYTLARASHNVATARLARACEVPTSTFWDTVRRFNWPVPYTGAALLPGTEPTATVRAAAALASIGGTAAIAGDTALHLHGLLSAAPTTVHLAVPPTRHGRSGERLLVRRTAWHHAHLTKVDGLSILDPALSLVHAAGRRTEEALRNLVIDARFHGLVTGDDIDAAIRAEPRAKGRARLAAIVAALADDGSDSCFEFGARDGSTEAGLPPDPEQRTVVTRAGGRPLDIPFGWARTAVECIGLAFHSSRDQVEADAHRDNLITEVEDWAILRLTWRRYHTGFDEFVAQLRAVLERRGGLGPA